MGAVCLNQRDEDDDAADGGDDGEGFEHGLSWWGKYFHVQVYQEGRCIFAISARNRESPRTAFQMGSTDGM